jgi:acetyltransferase-like isoleucine patch superfamily enzyme
MTKPLAFIGTRTGADGVIRAAQLMGIPIAGWFDRFYHGSVDSFQGFPILGSDLAISAEDRDRYQFFLATHYSGHSVVHNPKHNGMTLRRERIELMRDLELDLATIVHPGAYVDPSATVGRGVYLAFNSVVGARCYVGDFSYLCFQVSIGHDVTLQGNNLLLAHTVIGGNVTLEQDVFAGLQSTVAPASGQPLTVGRGAKIAAGAVVYRDVAPDQFVSREGRRLRKLDADF